jgi:hypothetical protein
MGRMHNDAYRLMAMSAGASSRQRFPFAAIAVYAPDTSRATKLVASVFKNLIDVDRMNCARG